MAVTAKRDSSAPDPSIAAKGYVRPDVLVSTDWLAEHLDDPNIRIIESDEDVLLYDTGHIPGAQKVDWHQDLNDPVLRDYVSSEQFEKLLREKGIDENTTVVFYGDKNNWWAAYAFWVFQLFGFTNAKLLDGGRIKWEQEGRPFATDVPSFPSTSYRRRSARTTAFVRFSPTLESIPTAASRSSMYGRPRNSPARGCTCPTIRRKGRCAAATSRARRAFRGRAPPIPTEASRTRLRAIYEKEKGLKKGDDIVAYCRIGERSSHTWFVLTYLLGYDNVRNYDGSWTEWGNAVRAPIEKGAEK